MWRQLGRGVGRVVRVERVERWGGFLRVIPFVRAQSASFGFAVRERRIQPSPVALKTRDQAPAGTFHFLPSQIFACLDLQINSNPAVIPSP